MEEVLALTDQDIWLKSGKVLESSFKEYKKNPSILKKPMSEIAHSMGLTPQELLVKFIPLISKEPDINELGKWAKIGVKILKYLDTNMWRTNLPEAYTFVVDAVKDAINELYEQDDNNLKRMALDLHIEMSNVAADKKRFIETIINEDRLLRIAKTKKRHSVLKRERRDAEEKARRAGIIDISCI